MLPAANSNAEYWFRYKVNAYRARMLLRCNSAKTSFLALNMYTNQMVIEQNNNGTWTTLDSDAAVTSPVGTWYDMYVKANGSTIEVWRGLSGQAMTKVADSTSCAVLSGTQVEFIQSSGSSAYYDDFALVTASSTGDSFTDDFADGNYTANPAWTIGYGTWSAASNYMRNTASSSNYPSFTRNIAFQNAEIKFSYLKEDTNTCRFSWRDANANQLVLGIYSNRMTLTNWDGSTWTTLASNTAATNANNVWYDVQLIMDRGKVEVWRREGASSFYCHIFTVTNNAVTDATQIQFMAHPNAVVRFDNIDIAVDDPSLTEYAYNGSNELLRMTENGVPTAFTYDAWGRTTLKTMNGYTAGYQYRYGDKLKRVDSTFPGENALVQYMYDGLGKRRMRQVDMTSMTYYRWNGWNEYSEYLQGSGGFWDMNGTARRTYLPGLGEAYSAGSASMADYTYWTTDHLGSVRGIYMQDRTPYGRYAYDPYGKTRFQAGLPLNVGFTGHIWDACIQQYFAPFRYYNPAAARWTMRDPLWFIDGTNMYGYLSGNPVIVADRLGLTGEATLACTGAGTAVFPGIGTAIGAVLGVAADAAIATAILILVASIPGDNTEECQTKKQPKEPSQEAKEAADKINKNPDVELDPPWEKTGRNWYNPETKESLSPDCEHAEPIGPHVDWTVRKNPGPDLRINPDGTCVPKT